MENDMGKRGVTRPMMKIDKGGESMKMSHGDRMDMLMMHHKQTLWVYWLVVILGFWVTVSPLTFDYGKNPFVPSGGRSVWLDLNSRVQVMRWSDIVSGILLIIFGYRSLMPSRPVSVWICRFVGIWLSMAPLIFWSPSALAYMNDTLVGALVMGLTVLVPGMPNMIMYMKMGQHSLPVSDAGLGSFAYTFEFLMGFMGSAARWRTMRFPHRALPQRVARPGHCS